MWYNINIIQFGGIIWSIFFLKPFKINDLLMTISLDKTLLMWYSINIMQFDDTNWIQNWTGGQCPAPPP